MRWTTFRAVALAFAIGGGCGGSDARTTEEATTSGGEQAAAPEGGSSEAARVAVARLESDPSGPHVDGTVVFTEREGGGVVVEANVSGVEPGPHGFHVHEVGECTPPTFESAGGHFAAEGQRHAGPTDPGHHVGDLGNVEVGPSGNVRYSIRSDDLTLDGGDRSVVGRSVVIHAARDDYETQPTGNSGARIACGVIRRLE